MLTCRFRLNNLPLSAISLGAASFPAFSGEDRRILYSDDLKIDDQTFCDKVIRGQLRLHPAGWTGQSAGCVTLPFMRDFLMLRQTILSQEKFDVPCADMNSYGQLVVS
jgi:Protein of unknown function (DUF2778)